MSRENPSATRLREILLFFWGYNRRYAIRYFPYLASNVAGVLIGGIITPLYLREFIDAISEAQAATPALMRTLHTLLMVIGIWSLARVLCVFLSDYCITRMGPQAIMDIENDCFMAIHALSLSFFAGTQVGKIVAGVKRFSNAYNMLDIHITRGLLESTVQVVATVVVVSLFSSTLALIFVAWGILYLLVIFTAVQWKMRLDVQKVHADSASTGLLADGVTNALTVKMFARFRTEYGRFQKATEAVAKATRRSWYGSTIINALQALIVAVVSVVILFLALRLWQNGKISIGTIVLVQTYVFIIGAHFLQLGDHLKIVYRAAADCMEMMAIIRLKPTVRDPDHPKKLRVKRGAITFQSVSFGYHQHRDVFHCLSLVIPQGQRVGIVGHSGAGKSTLIALLLRFMDVREGAVMIDEQDVRSVTQDDLRSHISYVPQEPLLFHRSIKENIAYGKPNASHRDIIRAARQAHAHEFIEQFPQGYETIVGERGMKLSGGERQRIAIARAMLKDAPILLLDEATSSLDSTSENLIRDAFETLVTNRTTLVIAHRLSTIQKMDRIIVLEKGVLVEDGSHEALLRQNGIYAELWKHQSHGFLGV